MKQVKLKRRVRKGFAFFSTCFAAYVLMLLFSSGASAAKAADRSYELWIGDTRVTSDNCDNILGETGKDGKPTASYDADTLTLYLNGVTVQSDYNGYALYSTSMTVCNLVITGENSFFGGKGNFYIEVGVRGQGLSGHRQTSIKGTGTLFCAGKFTFKDVETNGWRLKYGVTVDTEKGLGEGPVIEAKNGIIFEELPIDLYGGMMKAEANFRPVNTAKELLLHNDSLIVAKDRTGRQAIWAIPHIDDTNNDRANGHGCIKGQNGYYSGWVVYGKIGAVVPLALDETDIDPTAENYSGTDIDVLGFTKDAVVYSVDVEWGAMTFRYENSTWDAAEHRTVAGAGWQVYDSEKNKPAASAADAINRLTVTNHSNADVFARLAYAGAQEYADTDGSFAKGADDMDTVFDETGSYLTLGTADNSGDIDVAGTPTAGNVYFMPEGIKEEYKTDEGITKWQRLGTITVSVLTEEPN